MNLALIYLFVGSQQVLVVLVIVLLLFGGRKIPELMKGIGTGIKEFKKASKAEDEPDKKLEEK